MSDLKSLEIGDLKARVPIVQGGMGVRISLARLAAAVANEGGIGVIATAGIGLMEPDYQTNFEAANIRALRTEIRKARAATMGIVGVNIMVALTQFADLVRTAVEEKADIIFAGAGLPLDLPSLVRESARTRLAPIVSSARAAVLIARKWLGQYRRLPDAVVVEGPLAGGHLGFRPEQIDDPRFTLEKIVPEVVREMAPFGEQAGQPIPVIAGGGIYTGADIHKFMAMGAAGVQMATRFVATVECDAAPEFKQAYLDAQPQDLTIIRSPVGLPGRAIRNAFIDDVSQGRKKPFFCPFHCIRSCDPARSPYCIALALGNAAKGKLRNGFVFAGANAHRIRRLISVSDLVASLRREFQAATA